MIIGNQINQALRTKRETRNKKIEMIMMQINVGFMSIRVLLVMCNVLV